MPRGNKNFGKTHGFIKGDSRINRKGRPRVLPELQKLMNEMLGVPDGKIENLDKSQLKKIIQAAIDTAANKKSNNQINAFKELMDRAFGKTPTKLDLGSSAPVEFVVTKTYANDTKGKSK